jgi:membrane protein YdbS with pleckstrin-like domain
MTINPSSTFPSRIDTWLVGVIVVAALGAVAACAVLLTASVPRGWMVATSLLLTTVGLPVWLLTTTRYQFQGEELLIRSGPFKWSVPIRQVKTVSDTRNPMSSPALSLDRLLIEYGQGKSIMVSPQDRQGFLAELNSRRRAVV